MEINCSPDPKTEGKGRIFEVTLDIKDLKRLSRTGSGQTWAFSSVNGGIRIELYYAPLDTFFREEPKFRLSTDGGPTGFFIEIGDLLHLANDNLEEVKKMFECVEKIPMVLKVPVLFEEGKLKEIIFGHVVFKVRISEKQKDRSQIPLEV